VTGDALDEGDVLAVLVELHAGRRLVDDLVGDHVAIEPGRSVPGKGTYDGHVGESQGRILTGLVRIAPHRGDHRVALRAAVSIGVPLLVLWASGSLELSMYASFGAFASLYGRHDGYADRVRMQAGAGACVLLAMLVGTTLAFTGVHDAVRIVVVALIAAAVTLVAHAWRWHPPSALFAVFAAGATASLPATAASFLHVLIVAGASALFSVALTTSIALVRRRGRLGLITRRRMPADREAVAIALTIGVGALLAGFAGYLLIGTHWYWATVAAVAALGGAQLNARIIRGGQRLIGTLLGVLIAAGLLALQLPPLATIAVAVLCQVGAELTVGRNYGIAMLFITPLALLMIALAVPTDPAVLLRDRALETVLGVLVGTAIAVASAMLRRRRHA